MRGVWSRLMVRARVSRVGLTLGVGFGYGYDESEN